MFKVIKITKTIQINKILKTKTNKKKKDSWIKKIKKLHLK